MKVVFPPFGKSASSFQYFKTVADQYLVIDWELLTSFLPFQIAKVFESTVYSYVGL